MYTTLQKGPENFSTESLQDFLSSTKQEEDFVLVPTVTVLEKQDGDLGYVLLGTEHTADTECEEELPDLGSDISEASCDGIYSSTEQNAHETPTISDVGEMATFAYAAYANVALADQRLVEGRMNLDGYKSYPFKSKAGQHAGHVFCKGEKVVVAFAGTYTGADLCLDLNARYATHQGVTAHAGFMGRYLETKDAIHSAIKDHAASLGKDEKDLHIEVTGHSMGGAVATLCALFAAKSGLNVASVITFGSPRVLAPDSAIAYRELLGGKTTRVTISKFMDVVTAVPFGFMGFEHVISPTILHETFSMVNPILNHLMTNTYMRSPAASPLYGQKTCFSGISRCVRSFFSMIQEACSLHI